MDYRISKETGEELRVFRAEEFQKGASGAQIAAARAAVRLMQDEGLTVLLSGPEGFTTRRYSPEYHDDKWRPYRVRCSVEGCPHWVHPVNPRQAPTCREHFAKAPETAARVKRMNAARLGHKTP